jgi:hypothetical protein
MRGLLRVVKNDAHGVAPTGADPADSMPQIDPIDPTASLYRPLTHGENDGIALAEWHHLGPGLHPGTLFGHYEFSTSKVPARLREQDRHLEWKDVFAVDVLVEAVVVLGIVLQQKRSRIPLPGCVTSGDELPMLSRKSHCDSKRLIPSICNWSQARIERTTERSEQRRQWIAEILVLAPAEAVTRHNHTGAESGIPWIQAGQYPALLGREQTLDHTVSPAIQILRYSAPIDLIELLSDSLEVPGNGL